MSSCTLFPGVRSKRVVEDALGEEWWNLSSVKGGGIVSDEFKAVLMATVTPAPLARADDVWDSFEQAVRPREGFSCPACETGAYVTIESDEVLCTACGTHIEWLIDTTAEYRHYGAEDRSPDPARVGNPIDSLTPESSLSTRMLPRPGESREMQKMRKMHGWNIAPYKERRLWGVFDQLQERASNAGIPLAIVNESKHLYAQVSPLCICRGVANESLLAACLYESLKRHDKPWRPAEIAKIFQIDVKHVTKGVKQFSGLLEEYLHNKAATAAAAGTATGSATGSTTGSTTGFTTATGASSSNTTTAKAATDDEEAMSDVERGAAVLGMAKTETPSTRFQHYLESAIYKLETPRTHHGHILRMATRIGEAIDKYGICPETTPSSLAAASLALTCEHMGFLIENTQERVKSVARVCAISPATLQKCLKRIDERWRAILFKEMA